MWKKRIAAVFAIIVLVGVAIGFPLVINYYSDKKLVNKIKYVESKDIDILSASENMDVASKLNILDEQLLTDEVSMILELNFEPTEEQKNEIYDNVETEINKWLDGDVIGLEQAGIQVSGLSDFVIESIRLYSIDKISFFEVEAILSEYPYTSIRIAMDSDCYKIYSIRVSGEMAKSIMGFYEEYKMKNSVDYTDVSVDAAYVLDEIAYKIGRYYELETPELIKEGENIISYNMLSNLSWRIKLYADEIGEPIVEIGIPEFNS